MLIAVFGGIEAFGAIGILVGPMFVAMFVATLRIYERNYRLPSTEGASARRAARQRRQDGRRAARRQAVPSATRVVATLALRSRRARVCPKGKRRAAVGAIRMAATSGGGMRIVVAMILCGGFVADAGTTAAATTPTRRCPRTWRSQRLRLRDLLHGAARELHRRAHGGRWRHRRSGAVRLDDGVHARVRGDAARQRPRRSVGQHGRLPHLTTRGGRPAAGASAAATHCPHASMSGGGVCGDRCASFCALATFGLQRRQTA